MLDKDVASDVFFGGEIMIESLPPVQTGYDSLKLELAAAFRASGDGWGAVELVRDVMREAHRDRGKAGDINLSRKLTDEAKGALNDLDGDVRGRLVSLARNEPLSEESLADLRRYFGEHFPQAEAAVRCILGAHIEAHRSVA